MINFFIAGEPPTVTQQEHRVGKRRDGSVYIYEDRELKAARTELLNRVYRFRPERPLLGPVRLLVKWCFKSSDRHPTNTFKTSKPDTDNLNKMLKDVMTDAGFWKDDAQVASEIIEKFYSDVPGIYIQVENL